MIFAKAKRYRRERDDWKRWCKDAEEREEALNDEIDRLATFILDEVDGEPSQSQGAVDTAIRLIRGCQ